VADELATAPGIPKMGRNRTPEPESQKECLDRQRDKHWCYWRRIPVGRPLTPI